MLSINSEQNDKFYLGVRIGYNPGADGISPCRYIEQLNQPILHNPSDYYMVVDKFTIPTQNIPLFVAEIQPPPNTNVNNTIYSVTLEYNGSISQQYIQFITEQPNIIPPAVVNQQNNSSKSPYYFVYTYTNFIDMVNQTIANAFASLVGLPVGAQSPYFIFDPINERISLVTQYTNFNEGASPRINIYMNIALFTFFSGLSEQYLGYNMANGMDVRIIVRYDGNNTYNPILPNSPTPTTNSYLIMTQQFPALVNWLSVKSIALVTNLIPCRLQYSVGNIQTVGSNTSSNQSIVNVQGLLSSFEPILDTGVELAGSQLQYITNGPYKLINMTGKTSISTIDITAYWIDQFGNQYLIDIPFNQVAIIEFAFFKKSTFTS